MNDPGAIKRALRLKRARMLVSQGRFQRNGDALPATASVPMTESVAVMPPRGVGGNCFPNNAASMNSADIGRTRGRGDGSRGRGRFVSGLGRGADRRGRPGAARTPRVVVPVAPKSSVRSQTLMFAEYGGTPRKIWQPKSARALDMETSQQGPLPAEPDAPVMALPGDDDVERPTLPIHVVDVYDTLGELGKGQFGVVSQAVRRKGGGGREVVAIKMLKFDFEKEGFPLHFGEHTPPVWQNVDSTRLRRI